MRSDCWDVWSVRRARTHIAPRSTGSGRHGRPLRTARPLWRIAAGTPQEELGGSHGTIARGLGREPQPRPRAMADVMPHPYRDPRPRLRRGMPQEPGAPATPYACRPVSDLPAWGRQKRPHYAAGCRPRATRTAPKAPSGCVDRACHGPASPWATTPRRTATIPGAYGTRGPPMGHCENAAVAHRKAMSTSTKRRFRHGI